MLQSGHLSFIFLLELFLFSHVVYLFSLLLNKDKNSLMNPFFWLLFFTITMPLFSSISPTGPSRELLSISFPTIFLPKPFFEFSKYSNSEKLNSLPFLSK